MREEIKLQKTCQNILDENRNVLSVTLIGSRARGDFKGFDCSSLIINKKLELKNDINKIFKNR